jgi:hypothetical protein
MFCAEAQHAKTSEWYAAIVIRLMMLAAPTFAMQFSPHKSRSNTIPSLEHTTPLQSVHVRFLYREAGIVLQVAC